MNYDNSYRKAFFAAVILHLFLGIMLVMEFSTSHPALTPETQNEPGVPLAEENNQPKQEIVKAVSVNGKEVQQTVDRLKQERAREIRAEQSRQKALQQKAEIARSERLKEQKRLNLLKEESAKMAIARKKQIEEEQKNLKQLAMQKEKEAKRIEELKKQQHAMEQKQQQEARKLAELKKEAERTLAEKKAEQNKESAEKASRVAADKAAKDAAEKASREAAAEKAANDAAQRAKIAGEVDIYKAKILNAISQRWILPEEVDPGLSSQLRIRLGADGTVLLVSLTRSSGNVLLDRSAEQAIFKASPLPVPSDPATFEIFRDISLTVRPQNIRG